VHARTAEAFETVGRQGMRGFEAARRAVKKPGVGRTLLAVAAVAGVGLAIASLTRGSTKRSWRGRRRRSWL